MRLPQAQRQMPEGFRKGQAGRLLADAIKKMYDTGVDTRMHSIEPFLMGMRTACEMLRQAEYILECQRGGLCPQ